jgi:ubiquinone/menaquinone biosynthesis C-methylase UbiE
MLPFGRGSRRLAPEDAYRLWSETYDAQPENVVLAIEQELFDVLLSEVSLAGKAVVDIGCGTGRHWSELRARGPRLLYGVDSSPEMLDRLRARHPDATVFHRTGKTMPEIADGSIDVIVSTLMLAHVRDVDGELSEWGRILAPSGEVVLTDFHPEAERAGAKRTFRHRDATFEVESHGRPVEELRTRMRSHGLRIARIHERTRAQHDPSFFERGDIHEADRKGWLVPLLLGIHAQKTG